MQINLFQQGSPEVRVQLLSGPKYPIIKLVAQHVLKLRIDRGPNEDNRTVHARLPTRRMINDQVDYAVQELRALGDGLLCLRPNVVPFAHTILKPLLWGPNKG